MPIMSEPVYIVVDPAAGGPGSDYAFVSITRHKGMITVLIFTFQLHMYVSRKLSIKASKDMVSSCAKAGITLLFSSS